MTAGWSAGTTNTAIPCSPAMVTVTSRCVAAGAQMTIALRPSMTNPSAVRRAFVSACSGANRAPSSSKANAKRAVPPAIAASNGCADGLDDRPRIAGARTQVSRKGSTTSASPIASMTGRMSAAPPPMPPADSGMDSANTPRSWPRFAQISGDQLPGARKIASRAC